MATPQGYMQVNEVNNGAFQSAFATLATLTGVPLVGNPEAVAQRLEELTSIVGTLAEAMVHTAPIINNNAADSNLLAAHAVSLETQIHTVETKLDYAEFQRAQGKGGNGPPNGNAWIPKAACEAKQSRTSRIWEVTKRDSASGIKSLLTQ